VTSVLVVEDDDDIRALVADFLQLLGCRVDAVSNGRDALERVRGNTPDLILLDLAMPVMDGRQFSAAARREQLLSDVPIVLMSASPEGADIGRQIGANAFLRKPFNLDQVAAVVERLGGGDGDPTSS
jgi:CheY-like chemotaxis protein